MHGAYDVKLYFHLCFWLSNYLSQGAISIYAFLVHRLSYMMTLSKRTSFE
jgi:hypothetical protein